MRAKKNNERCKMQCRGAGCIAVALSLCCSNYGTVVPYKDSSFNVSRDKRGDLLHRYGHLFQRHCIFVPLRYLRDVSRGEQNVSAESPHDAERGRKSSVRAGRAKKKCKMSLLTLHNNLATYLDTYPKYIFLSIFYVVQRSSHRRTSLLCSKVKSIASSPTAKATINRIVG